jgi:simple sugar transport system ATP-binding protein
MAEPSTREVIDCSELVRIYRGDGVEVQALQGLSLRVERGDIVAMVGASGSGKSTLLGILSGLDRPSAGRATVAGYDLTSMSRAQRLRYRREAVGFVWQQTERNLLPYLTVRENIVLGLQADRGWLRRISRRKSDEVVNRYIEALGIRPANPEAIAGNLSGGNQQKVLLARWLATAPKLLLLDEPTRGIDVGAKAEIQKLVAELAEQGMAVVFISAELDEVLRLSHRIAVLRDRRKVAEIVNSDDVTTDDVVHLIASGGQS